MYGCLGYYRIRRELKIGRRFEEMDSGIDKSVSRKWARVGADQAVKTSWITKQI